jgi:dUTP pyrophosphatase
VGVRVALSPTNFFSIAPRSGIGTKTGYHLTNTIGIIDADYYNAENEGHIYVSLERGFKDLTLKPHDRFCQGVIMKYETTIDDDVTQKRTGGLGSTAK